VRTIQVESNEMLFVARCSSQTSPLGAGNPALLDVVRAQIEGTRLHHTLVRHEHQETQAYN